MPLHTMNHRVPTTSRRSQPIHMLRVIQTPLLRLRIHTQRLQRQRRIRIRRRIIPLHRHTTRRQTPQTRRRHTIHLSRQRQPKRLPIRHHAPVISNLMRRHTVIHPQAPQILRIPILRHDRIHKHRLGNIRHHQTKPRSTSQISQSPMLTRRLRRNTKPPRSLRLQPRINSIRLTPLA